MKLLAPLTVIGATAAALLFSAAWAQDARFLAADANGDGVVTLTELQAVFPDVTEDQFDTADANGDSALDRDEFATLVAG